MFSQDYLNKVYDCYNDDIDIESFRSQMPTLLKTLILYKELDDSIDSYTFDGMSLRIINKTPITEDMATKNAIFVFRSNDWDTLSSYEWFNKEWYEELISAFINRQFGIEDDADEKIAVYIDNENRVLYIQLPLNLSTNSIQILVCGLITKLMPWQFKDVDREIMTKITSTLGNRENNEFDEMFEEAVKNAGITQIIMQRDLEKLSGRLKEAELASAENAVLDYQRIVNDCFERMCDVNDGLRKAKSRLAALKLTDDRDGGVKEIVDFLKSTTQDIEVEAVTGCELHLILHTTLQTFDEWDKYVEYSDCYLYRDDEYGFYHSGKTKRAYTALFSNPDIKIHTGTGIVLDLSNGNVRAYDPRYRSNETEHPHLNGDYSCFGSAAGPIAEYIKDYRYTEALSQMVYAARQFTVSDGAAGNKLLRGLADRKCIELPNGEYVNMQGLMEYLDETEGEV